MPAAEREITADLVGELLREQHPDLARLPLSLEANGWDNAIFRLGEDLAVRLPRRQASAQLIRNEQRWLPGLVEGLDTVTSVPVRAGAPSSSYPWFWSITRWVEGDLAAHLPAAHRAPAAQALAHFLLGFQQPAPPDAPDNPVRGVPLSTRNVAVEKRIATGKIPGGIAALWPELRDQPAWNGPKLWLHGDLHPANLVLEDNGTLKAVLDFGDMAGGDPATDLAAAWLVFDRSGRSTFTENINAVRPTDTATWHW